MARNSKKNNGSGEGAVSSDETRKSGDHDQLIKEICASSIAEAEAILGTGELCARADVEFPKETRKELLKRLPFEPSKFSKLATIGRATFLKDIIDRLPPSYTIIYAVAKLSDEQRTEAVEKDVIRTTMKAKDLGAFLKSKSAKLSATQPTLKAVDDILVSIARTEAFDITKESELVGQLTDLVALYGAKVIASSDSIDESKLNEIVTKGIVQHVKILRKTLKDAKARPSLENKVLLEDFKITGKTPFSKIVDVVEALGLHEVHNALVREATAKLSSRRRSAA